MKMLRTLGTALVAGVIALWASPALAVYDVIIDDADAQFLDWQGQLQTGNTDAFSGGNGTFQYIDNWGDQGNLASARVRYYPPNLPPGERQYEVYAWSPGAHSSGFHSYNATEDGVETVPGQFLNSSDFSNQGDWVQLGPGFSTVPGRFILNGDAPSDEYIFIKYQSFYNAANNGGNPHGWAFDAIRVVEVPEPSTIAVSLFGLGGLGLVALRRRRGQAS